MIPIAQITYRIDRSYAWNYEHAPEPVPTVAIPSVPGGWDYCGLAVGSPLGIAAGLAAIGQGLSGVSTLSLGSLLAFAAIGAGAAMTMKWRARGIAPAR